LREYFKAINPEDAKKISSLLVKFVPDAERLAHELTEQSDENVAIHKAAERLRHLRGNIPPRRWILLVVTWLCTTSGMCTAVAVPGTITEINSQTSTLGLGVAVTIALISSRKHT
jgi:hypothetical protein